MINYLKNDSRNLIRLTQFFFVPGVVRLKDKIGDVVVFFLIQNVVMRNSRLGTGTAGYYLKFSLFFHFLKLPYESRYLLLCGSALFKPVSTALPQFQFGWKHFAIFNVSIWS
jgi:hypothetical protein